jgi:hypothetical protein
MNNEESKFVPLSEKLTTPFSGKNPIIKGNKIRRTQTKVIDIKKEESITKSESDEVKDSKIEPILEGNKIVGINFTCNCGEESEIRFEVEGETKEESLEEDKIEDVEVEKDVRKDESAKDEEVDGHTTLDSVNDD